MYLLLAYLLTYLLYSPARVELREDHSRWHLAADHPPGGGDNQVTWADARVATDEPGHCSTMASLTIALGRTYYGVRVRIRVRLGFTWLGLGLEP